MTTLNNFDTSSSGVNIEFTGFYSNDRSSNDFNESFMKHGDKWIFTSYGNLPSDWQPIETLDPDVPIEDFIKVCLAEDWYNFLCRIESVKDKLVVLHEQLGVDSWREIGYDEIAEWALEFFDSDVTENLRENYLTKNYTEKRVRGYSQGDVIDVVVPDALRNILGVPDEFEIVTDQEIENLVYRAPVDARITINGTEEFLDDVLSDVYHWDKGEAMGFLKKYYDQTVIDWCEENLPTDLGYDY